MKYFAKAGISTYFTIYGLQTVVNNREHMDLN